MDSLQRYEADHGSWPPGVASGGHTRPPSNRRSRPDRRCVPDGGVGWSDLTGFQRDLLMAIRQCAQEEQIPTGQTIKRRVEAQYAEEINNGRLYQNLGHLVESGLLVKGFVDGRTNTYSLEPSAVSLLDEAAHQFADICGLAVAAQRG